MKVIVICTRCGAEKEITSPIDAWRCKKCGQRNEYTPPKKPKLQRTKTFYKVDSLLEKEEDNDRGQETAE